MRVMKSCSMMTYSLALERVIALACVSVLMVVEMKVPAGAVAALDGQHAPFHQTVHNQTDDPWEMFFPAPQIRG